MPVLENLRPWIEAETGMDFSGTRLSRLHNAVSRVLPRFTTAGELNSLPLKEHGRFVERLTAELTVGESFFFRNDFHFQALRRQVIPEILHENAERREIRIWSAGCATGEEPYSLAILLDQMLSLQPRAEQPWTVSILGTDLNQEFLKRAREAYYRAWSFRNSDIHRNPQYFTPEKDGFRLSDRLRNQVHFAYLNLVKDVYPSPLTCTLGIDLILFRNVAIYLKHEVAAAIVERFCRALRPGGWLLLGETEVSFLPKDGYEVIRFEQATLLRKPADTAGLASWSLFPPPPVLGFESFTPNKGSASAFPNPIAPRPQPLTAADGSLTASPITPPPADAKEEAEDAGTVHEPPSPSLASLIDDLLTRRRFAEAEREIDRIGSFQERTAMRMRYIQGLLACAEVGRARRMLEICLREQPLLIQAQLLYASLGEEAGDLDVAERGYRHALYIDRYCAIAHFHLALVLQQKGDAESAARSLETMLKLIQNHSPETPVEYGEGVCCGRLREMAQVILDS